MLIQIKIILMILACCAFTYNNFDCTRNSVLQVLKRPAYEFSLKLLQKVAEDTEAHFVFSPLTTWLQIIALSEATTGQTFEEIWRLTKHQRNRCFRRNLHNIISRLHRTLKQNNIGKSVIVIDKMMSVKTRFKMEMQDVYEIEVMLLDFNKPMESTIEVNHMIEKGTDGMIDRILYEDDFFSTVLLLVEGNFFHSAWQTEFFRGYTHSRPFYSSSGTPIGTVKMMHQTGYFYMMEFSQLGVKILELPLEIPEVSMLLFVPTNKIWIGELFYNLQKTELAAIFNLLKIEEQKLVNVAIPKFNQVTEIENLPELLYEMGIRRIWDSNLSELVGISEYNVFATVMTQKNYIEVNERGGTFGVEFIAINETSVDFTANRPFAYMVIDKTIDFIIYTGVYSLPSNT